MRFRRRRMRSLKEHMSISACTRDRPSSPRNRIFRRTLERPFCGSFAELGQARRSPMARRRTGGRRRRPVFTATVRRRYRCSPVAGSRGSCPEVKTNCPAAMAWLYGPIAAGAASICICCMASPPELLRFPGGRCSCGRPPWELYDSGGVPSTFPRADIS